MNARRLAWATSMALWCGLVGACALASAPALALNTHVYSSSFGAPGTGAGQLSSPTGVAVNSVTHDVYIADTGNLRVDEFSASGSFLRAWGWGVADGLPAFETCTLTCQAGLPGSNPGQFEAPTFIAIDNTGGPSQGDVYVADHTNHLVTKFDESGNIIGGWGTGGQLNGSTATDGPFGSIEGIAVDTNGTLMVINSGKRMFEFEQNGTFSSDFFAEPERGTEPDGLAVDSAGHTFNVNGDGSVEDTVSPSGFDVGQVTKSTSAKGVAVDAAGDLYVDAGSNVEEYVFAGLRIVNEPGGTTCSFHSESGCGATEAFGSENLSGGTGIGVDGANGNVFVAESSGQVELFLPAVLADVITEQPTNVKNVSATFHGTVNPDGVAVSACKFEYGTTAAYGQTVACEQASGSISGTSPITVSAPVASLAPNTTYHVRLAATTASGTSHANDVSFPTFGPPQVDGESVSDVSGTSVTFEAQINPSGPSTEYRVEYGPTPAYGQSATGNAGEGIGDASISLHRQDVIPSTTYHFRFVAHNEYGTTEGTDRTFATQSAGGKLVLPDGRAWEWSPRRTKTGHGLNRSARAPSRQPWMVMRWLISRADRWVPTCRATPNRHSCTRRAPPRAGARWTSHRRTKPPLASAVRNTRCSAQTSRRVYCNRRAICRYRPPRLKRRRICAMTSRANTRRW